jgi:hypothetical protein
MPDPSCPFYGVSLMRLMPDQAAVLVPTNGNQCALITVAHSPCAMEIAGKDVGWDRCHRNPANTGEPYLVAIDASAPPSLDVPAEPLRVNELKAAREFAERFEVLGQTEPKAKP